MGLWCYVKKVKTEGRKEINKIREERIGRGREGGNGGKGRGDNDGKKAEGEWKKGRIEGSKPHDFPYYLCGLGSALQHPIRLPRKAQGPQQWLLVMSTQIGQQKKLQAAPGGIDMCEASARSKL